MRFAKRGAKIWINIRIWLSKFNSNNRNDLSYPFLRIPLQEKEWLRQTKKKLII